MPGPRLAVRAIIMKENRLLLVNAFAKGRGPELWCAPGGGVDKGTGLVDNLKREVWEECGLNISVGAPCLINEFHDPETGFHQVEIFFRCVIETGQLSSDWQDTENIVTDRKLFSREELVGIKYKPDSLSDIAWGEGFDYDPLEQILK